VILVLGSTGVAGCFDRAYEAARGLRIDFYFRF
jgi:hypothetical protein